MFTFTTPPLGNLDYVKAAYERGRRRRWNVGQSPFSCSPTDPLTSIRDIDLEPRPQRVDKTGSSSLLQSTPIATIIRDVPHWLSSIRLLQSTDVIILLTPVVIPISQDPTDISDPFEPLGRSLSRRHARIRHVPYTKRFVYGQH